MKKKDKAILKIDNAISEINQQINKIQLPEIGPESKTQLLEFRFILEIMREELNTSSKNKPEKDYGLGRIIIDSWSFENPLAELIVGAERSFIKALKEI